METEISRLTKAMESDIQLVIEANNAVEKNKEIIFSIRYLQLVLTDKARHTYKKSSRPPKMSPHMSSQTDLGGRPPKFGRTMAALRHTITVDTWRRMRQVIYKDLYALEQHRKMPQM